jgi:hypothetical protein
MLNQYLKVIKNWIVFKYVWLNQYLLKFIFTNFVSSNIILNVFLFYLKVASKTNVALLCILREIGKHIMSNGSINIDDLYHTYEIITCSRNCLEFYSDNSFSSLFLFYTV